MAPPTKSKRRAVTPSDFQARYEALKKLDPDIAFQYAVAVNSKNREAIKNTGTTAFQGGFGKILKDEVDLIIAAATDGDLITKEEEEALLIILGTTKNWGDGVKEYMIEQIEKNLKLFWSATAIDQQKATQLLVKTNQIDFVSPGTAVHFTSAAYQTVAHLIGRGKIAAWEVSREGFYKFIPGAYYHGYYSGTTHEIHIISGLSSADQQCYFVHYATTAIHDFRNSAFVNKSMHADSVIANAFVYLSLKLSLDPSVLGGEFAVAVRSGGAADMLMTPVSSRKANWKGDFEKAYNAVVDAYVERVGGSGTDSKWPLQAPAVGTAEKKLFMQEMQKVLKGTSTRSKP